MRQKRRFVPNDITETYFVTEGVILNSCSHADNKIKKRNIPIAEIIETFQNPDHKYPNVDFDNANNYVKRFGNHQLKIGVKDDKEPFVLITAFYLDLMEKDQND